MAAAGAPEEDEDGPARSPLMLEAMAADRTRAHIRGYLRKLNRHQHWQKRYFEVVDHFFVYYKRDDSPDLLCAMDLYQADPPRVLPSAPGRDGASQPSSDFCINYDRDRTFRASSREDAERWVGIILAVQRANPAHARPAAASTSASAAAAPGDAKREAAETESAWKDSKAAGGCCAVM